MAKTPMELVETQKKETHQKALKEKFLEVMEAQKNDDDLREKSEAWEAGSN